MSEKIMRLKADMPNYNLLKGTQVVVFALGEHKGLVIVKVVDDNVGEKGLIQMFETDIEEDEQNG